MPENENDKPGAGRCGRFGSEIHGHSTIFLRQNAPQYDKLFLDWEASVREQAAVLDALFRRNGFDRSAQILDCACGIGTQSIGLAALGYGVTASDISCSELEQAKLRAEKIGADIRFERADFRELHEVFTEQFDIVIAMDNALPHMLTRGDLEAAAASISAMVKPGGIFSASIRDYDSLLVDKPPYSPPYIHKSSFGRRVSFQTWEWSGDNYRLVQYMIDDEKTLSVRKFEREYRAVRRSELSEILTSAGFGEVKWEMPGESGFYQPIVTVRKNK